MVLPRAVALKAKEATRAAVVGPTAQLLAGEVATRVGGLGKGTTVMLWLAEMVRLPPQRGGTPGYTAPTVMS